MRDAKVSASMETRVHICTHWDEMGGLLFSEASSLLIMQGNKNLCPIRKGKGMG